MPYECRVLPDRYELVDEEGLVVAEVWDAGVAKLLAAAPNLLEALRECESLMPAVFAVPGGSDAAKTIAAQLLLGDIRAAIAEVER
jgi:hypothetical protein